jgi:aryl-alcohol dehydrogenase-like predicted oxidoreductase
MGQVRFDAQAASAYDALVQHALDHGVHFFDTSDAYWDGLHEQWLARALAGRRQEAIIASKFGNITLPDGRKATDARPSYLRACCEASLRRLKTDVIDLYYLHRVDPKVPIEDTIGEMARLVEEGKVRYLGICEASTATLLRAHAIHPITALQTELSLWYPDAWLDKRETLKQLGISFVGYSPLGRGLLTGRFASLQDLQPNDRRRIHPRFHEAHLQSNLALVNQMDPLAASLGLSRAQLALAWVINQGAEVVAVTGTQQIRYLDESIAAAEMRLPASTIDTLNQLFARDKRSGTRYPPEMLGGLDI